MNTNRMLPDEAIKKIWKRLKELSTNYLPLTGGTLSGKLSATVIDVVNDNWNGFAICDNNHKIRVGIQSDPSYNSLALYHKHPDSDYCEKFTLTRPADNLASEVWYQMYSSKNITGSTSDLTSGSSSLSTNWIHLVYS